MKEFKGTSGRLAMAGLCVGFLLPGADAPVPNSPPRLEVTHTDRVDFPAGGVLRMQNATGEVKVEGWDQPNVEITTIKSNKGDIDTPEQRAKQQALLDRVHIAAERKGDEVVVTTDFPKRLTVPGVHHWHGTATTFDLEYRIKVPRNARLVIDHNEGEVYIDDIAGNIQAHTLQGEIIVHLTGDAPRDINAKAASGSVESDFPGRETRQCCLLGHSFLVQNSAATQKLDLRIGYGDIVILKLNNPPDPAGLAPKIAP